MRRGENLFRGGIRDILPGIRKTVLGEQYIALMPDHSGERSDEANGPLSITGRLSRRA